MQTQKIWDYLCEEVQRHTQRAGFQKAVIGLSGGIDSAVTACITCQALGKENLLGLIMPSRHSSPASETDALALASEWGFETREIPITTSVDTIEVFMSGYVLHEIPNKIAHENLQARVRAVILMAVCNHEHRLLINTCNKSEDLVGYCTLYGDSCGAFAPLGDLYKTEVYQLAHWINDQDDLPNIPENILTKEPSAELSDGQLDSDDLPPYEVLDPILRMVVRKEATGSPTLQAIADKMQCSVSIVEDIESKLYKSGFKRNQSAPPLWLPPDLLSEYNGGQ